MMSEKELIEKIRQLRQIKPRKDWVVLTKNQILGEEMAGGKNYAVAEFLPKVFSSLFPKFQFRWILVPVLSLIFLSGLFVFAQNSLPGDLLYPLKKLTEKSQTVFVSEEEETKVYLELANKRLEELNKIAETNQVKKLAPAIDEAEKSLTEAAKDLKKKQKISREILDQTRKIKENKEKIEKVLGTQIGESEDWENALKELVERAIRDLEKMDVSLLSEEQKGMLEEAKLDFEAGNYSQALIKILNLSQNK